MSNTARDRLISSNVVEWKFDDFTTETNGKDKGGKDKKNGKKSTNGPKIVVDFSDDNASKTLLGCFFGEKNVLNFKSDHFQSHPVVSRNHNVKELKEALFDLNVQDLVTNSASDQVHVWLKNPGSAALDSITVDDAQQACKLFAAGHSLYCRAPSQFESLVVPRLIRELSFGIDAVNNDRYRRGEVETFFSRKGHLTDFHCDFQENFTVQLSGVKKWIFASSTACHPTRGCTPHFNAEEHNDVTEQQLKVLKLGDNAFRADQFSAEGVTLREVVVRPGDVLYHPAGVWHRVECIEDSISINISLTALSFADVFCSNLQQLLMENPLWRSAVYHEDARLAANGRPTAQQIAQSMIEQVPHIVQSLSAGDILPFPIMRNKLTTGGNTKDFISAPPAAEKEKKSKNAADDAGSGNEGWEGFEEVDEEDEEENEEEVATKKFEIDSSSVNALAFLQSTCSNDHTVQKEEAPKTEGKSSKRKASSGLFHEFAEKKLKFNPFAMIISEEEINAGRAASNKIDEDDVDAQDKQDFTFVVHCGFGNETLESTSRSVVRFSPNEEVILQAVLSQYHEERAQRSMSLFSKSKKFEIRTFTANELLHRLTKDKKNKSLDISEVVRVLISWHLVGVITIV